MRRLGVRRSGAGIAGPALLAGLAWLAPADIRAQAGGDAPPPETGWTSPAAVPTSADSLPAFRPDSLREATVRDIESGDGLLAAPRTARDSSDSVMAMLRGRRPSVSLHGGVNLVDLDALGDFQAAVSSRVARESLQTLQPYEAAHIAAPVGIQALWPILPWFDAVARTHSYWYKQTAVLRPRNQPAGSPAPTQEEFFAVQAHLAGAGLRYYVPPSLLSVTGKLGLYVQGVYYWLLGGAELYTNHGSAPADFDPAGSAWEIQLGFNHVVTRPWTISGGLGYMQQHFLSDRPWSAVLAEAPPPGDVEWGSTALQGFLQLNWHFGVAGRAAATGRPAGEATGAPAGAGTPVAPAN